MALFTHDDRGAGVLAERQDTFSGDLGVLQQRGGDIAVIVGGFRVIQDSGHLLQVLGSKRERAVVQRLVGEKRQGVWTDLEHGLAIKLGGGDALS